MYPYYIIFESPMLYYGPRISTFVQLIHDSLVLVNLPVPAVHRISAPQLGSCSWITGPAAEDVLPVLGVLAVLKLGVGHQVVRPALGVVAQLQQD